MNKQIRFGTVIAALLAVLLGGCATNKEPRSAQDAMAQSRAGSPSSAFTCYDSFGQPIADEQVVASRRHGQPYCGEYYGVQGQRRRAVAPSAGRRAPVLDPGSITLPPSPVPVPGGLGVFR